MADVFVSYKREDETRVQPLVEGLRACGLSVFWDQDIEEGEVWGERIVDELDCARCVAVVWSHGSVSPDGDFVRAEARRALERDVLLQAHIDRVRPPPPFGERQALDLVGWKGKRDDLRFVDVAAAVQARVSGDAKPKLRWPARRRRRRVALSSIVAPVLAGTLFMVSSDTRTFACQTPGVHTLCGTFGIGEVPTPDEAHAWRAAVEPMTGDGLREFIQNYPDGVYVSTARALLETCVTRSEFRWDNDTIRRKTFMGAGRDSQPTEQEALKRTLVRAAEDARETCDPFGSHSFRLVSTSFEVGETDCRPRERGYVCSVKGVAVCNVQRRRTVASESCAPSE